MVNNTTNINKTITSHIKSLSIKKTYDAGNPGPGLGQAQKGGGIKPVYMYNYL